MFGASWFADLPDDFEESVRIDRAEPDHREQAIQSYHMTKDSHRFVGDFTDRMLGQADDMRSGSNYWLYGYYGSGKSHLLTVLDGLLDSDWVDGHQDEIWNDLAPSSTNGLDELGDDWKTLHDEFYIIPVSVNLLKYQGQKQRSFSEIVLKYAHQNADLTGVDDGISSGLSPQLDVAYLEKWLRTTDVWPERQSRAKDILEDITTQANGHEWSSDELWEDIQQYGVLADAVLPKLFEEVNGTQDGYTDLQPSDIDPEEVVHRLEELRAAREEQLDKPVKLVLLLDEVSLFIETDFERLTELQTLAENIDDVGDGDIQLVATAQAKIEDVQPKFAAHGADFSIVKDRFPHRYQLPSKHVGDIAKRRLFEKSRDGKKAVQQLLDEASVKPTESLVYNEIKQNTQPELDRIDDEQLVDFYPFLPYHAPLFLEILFNLRQEAPDPAKSIFSGTARAILALMHNLLQEKVEEGDPDQIVTLVDFYEQIEPELKEILTSDMRVIEGSNAGDEDADGDGELDSANGITDEVDNGTLTEFDLDVAKAVLLLQHVHDIIPLNEGNIAVSVMSDLNGRSWISTQNRVEESLDRLQKYIRPTDDETKARYRFATQEERIIYDDTEASEANPDWDGILHALDEHLWDQVVQDLSLPQSVPYGESGEEYPVGYRFSIDGTEFGTTVDAEDGLEIEIEAQGIRPDHTPEQTDEETLYWTIDTDGLDDLRKHIIEWWALRDAISTQTAPPAVDRDLEERARAVRSKLVSSLQRGTYTIKDRTDIRGLSTAVQTAVDVSYPDDFHPMMLQVTEDRLQELASLSPSDPLPEWAQTIQVPLSDSAASQGQKTIQRNVLSLAGRQLKGRDKGLNLHTVLDGIVSEKPFYDEARPALCAILWGFCQKGRLVPVDEDGNTLENSAVLDQSRLSTIRLKLLPRESIGKLLQEGGFKETTETVADGLINLQEANQQLRASLRGLQEDVQLVSDTDIQTDAVGGLLDSFIEALSGRIDATDERLTVIKSQGDDLGEAIEQTNQAREWYDEVVDVWNRRLTSLYQFDLQLAAGDSRFGWVNQDVLSTVEAQRETLETFDGDWWTTDGWNVLISETETGLAAEIQASWETFVDEQGLAEFTDRIGDHPWIIPSTDLPAHVLNGFERTYITPIREVQHWYNDIRETVAVLDSDNADTLVSATNQIVDRDSLSETTDCKMEELESRLDRLTRLVDDHTPDDIDQIGVLPEDRQAIDQRLERLVEDRDLNIEAIEEGVIIQ